MSYCIYKTPAFVIREHKSYDIDRKIFIYTKSFGKIIANIRGAQSTASKLRGFLGEGRCVNLELIRGKGGFIIVGANVGKSDFFIDFLANRLFIRILSHIERFSYSHSDSNVFEILLEIREALLNSDESMYTKISIVGFAKLLMELGYWEDYSVSEKDIISQAETSNTKEIQMKIKEILEKISI